MRLNDKNPLDLKTLVIRFEGVDCSGTSFIKPQAAAASSLHALQSILAFWTQQIELPTVLLIDEIDSLIGDTLVSVLRQLRSGYDARPKNFPQSIILCGALDVRDYRIHVSSSKDPITGGSAFNINAESHRIDPFARDEVRSLYHQHTAATEQSAAVSPKASQLQYQSLGKIAQNPLKSSLFGDNPLKMS